MSGTKISLIHLLLHGLKTDKSLNTRILVLTHSPVKQK